MPKGVREAVMKYPSTNLRKDRNQLIYTSQPRIRPETTAFGIGPLDFDVEKARSSGWSAEAIERVAEEISDIGHREFRRAHRNGPVKTCTGVECDRKLRDHQLPDEYRRVRRSWRDRGVWP